MHGMPIVFVRCLIFSLGVFVSTAAVAAQWVVTRLPDNFVAMAINNHGAIVGNVASRAHRYANGQLQEIGTLGGRYSEARDINDAGHIVGKSELANGDWHAYYYIDGTMYDLGGNNSDARAVNNSGHVTLTTYIDGIEHAFLYINNAWQDMGFMPGFNGAFPIGINDVGQVTGAVGLLGVEAHAFIYSNGAYQDLGLLGRNYSAFSVAYDISNSGIAVGVSSTDQGATHAFMYRDGTMIDMFPNALISVARAINDDNHIVGNFTPDGASPPHPFLYRDGEVIDISTLPEIAEAGLNVVDAKDINDSGQILLGLAPTDPNDNTRSALLTPVEPSTRSWRIFQNARGRR